MFSLFDFLMRLTGIDNYTFFTREVSVDSARRRTSALFFTVFITFCHAFSLLMEMLVVHVALTNSFPNLFQYVISDCFKELTLTVLKKADHKMLFSCALDDAVERVQISIYVLSALT